jgi:mannose-1-phosphate guanylyltransferase
MKGPYSSTDEQFDDLYILIMAGGRGTRFWPVSRRSKPKQCLSIVGESSLIRQTVDRVSGVVPVDRILVVTASEMAEAVRSELPELPENNILVEPMGRNTAPCIGWGAVEIGRRTVGDSAVMVVLPADHLIHDEQSFQGQLLECAAAAQSTNGLITIGVTPTRPETGFGYLQIGEVLGEWGQSTLSCVAKFVEKPDLSTAEQYLKGGEHLWNAGMFVFSIKAISEAFSEFLPDSWKVLEQVREDPARVAELYPQLEKISIDYGIMERSSRVFTVPAAFDWSDLGGWIALGDELPAQPFGVGRVAGGSSIDAKNNIVFAPSKHVSLIGVEGLVIVETDDAIMVCRREDAQRIKQITAELEERQLLDLL